jgi:hypothetical protein
MKPFVKQFWEYSTLRQFSDQYRNQKNPKIVEPPNDIQSQAYIHLKGLLIAERDQAAEIHQQYKEALLGMEECHREELKFNLIPKVTQEIFLYNSQLQNKLKEIEELLKELNYPK